MRSHLDEVVVELLGLGYGLAAQELAEQGVRKLGGFRVDAQDHGPHFHAHDWMRLLAEWT